MIKELTVENTNLPAGWEMKTLGDISDFQRGLTYSGKDAVDFSENIVLRATNIDLDKSCLDFSELKYLNNDFQVKQNKKIVKGGLLICLSSGSKKHLGKVALVTDDYNYAFGGFIGQIIPDNQVVSKYLFYNLVSESYKKYISELTDGIGINNLKSIDLKSFEIPLPPLSQQKQIVTILDKAFAAIDTAKANAEQNLQNAKELFESYLQNVFSTKGDDWEEKTLENVCESISAGGDKPKELSKFKTEKFTIPIYANGEKNKGLYGFTNVAKVLEPSITISGRGTIGYSEIRNEPFTPIVRLIVLIPKKEKIDIKFLKYIVSNINFINSGSSIPQLTVPMVKGYKITYPSIKEQEKIVQKLDALSAECEKLEAIYTQKIADLEEMKKSILQKAFSGQLYTIN